MECVMKEIITSMITDDSSTSSEDETTDSDFEMVLLQEQKQIPKIEGYIKLVGHEYSEVTFQSHFRLTRSTVEILIGRLGASGFIPSKENGGREKVSVEESLLITLWYLANNETFRQISDRFNVSLSSAHRVILRVLDFILSVRLEFIRWPSNAGALKVSNAFEVKKGIKNIIGAIDGCHIRIEKPKEHEDLYINRKGYHSILIQGVVTPHKKFTDVYCGESGSMHDRLLWKSSLFRKAEENPNYFGNMFLIGDSAYPSLSWLVPPFKDNGNLTPNQRSFNYRHSSSRMVVGHTIGLLKGRFRIMKHLTNESIDITVKIVMACCVLHNICIEFQDKAYVGPCDISNDINDGPEPWRDCIEGNRRREALFREMFPDNN